jgi:hypothetical protein
MKYTRELTRIKATQYRQRISRYGRETVYNTKPVSFSQWFLQGLRKYEARGADFELLPGMVKIQWPGKVALLRSVDDFKKEYQKEYLGQRVTA